jgi:hypothetical protein
MTTTTTGRAVDAGTVHSLLASYKLLVKAGENSVRSAWRFGQCIDSFTDAYTMAQLADAMNLSSGTLHRYHRLFVAYQRPELAVQASEQLETYNIDIIWQLHDDLHPVAHGRPMAGRRFRSVCHSCGGHDVGRVEMTPEEAAAYDAEAERAEREVMA